MLYAPWCGHCKAVWRRRAWPDPLLQAKPELVAAAASLAGNKKVLFGGVDCTDGANAEVSAACAAASVQLMCCSCAARAGSRRIRPSCTSSTASLSGRTLAPATATRSATLRSTPALPPPAMASCSTACNGKRTFHGPPAATAAAPCRAVCDALRRVFASRARSAAKTATTATLTRRRRRATCCASRPSTPAVCAPPHSNSQQNEVSQRRSARARSNRLASCRCG